MDGGLIAMIEMLIVFFLAIGWGLWELASLRRLEREREARKRQDPDAS